MNWLVRRFARKDLLQNSELNQVLVCRDKQGVSLWSPEVSQAAVQAATSPDRIPPGQHLVENFPVLTAGPTPSVEPSDWKFTVKIGPKPVKVWNWSEFNALPKTKMTRDIHCVTSWSKLDTAWEGVLIEDIPQMQGSIGPPISSWRTATIITRQTSRWRICSGKAMVASTMRASRFPRDHGGPARLLVPHLYFWKSAKWVNALQFTTRDEAGFWELRGYHIYGDPWREQRYTND